MTGREFRRGLRVRRRSRYARYLSKSGLTVGDWRKPRRTNTFYKLIMWWWWSGVDNDDDDDDDA